MPLNDYNLTKNSDIDSFSIREKTNASSKPFLFDRDNFRHIHTIDKERVENKRHHKLCQNRSCICYFVLALVLVLFIAVAIIVPVAVVVLKTTTTVLTSTVSSFF